MISVKQTRYLHAQKVFVGCKDENKGDTVSAAHVCDKNPHRGRLLARVKEVHRRLCVR